MLLKNSAILLRDLKKILNNEKIPYKTPNKNGTVMIAVA